MNTWNAFLKLGAVTAISIALAGCPSSNPDKLTKTQATGTTTTQPAATPRDTLSVSRTSQAYLEREIGDRVFYAYDRSDLDDVARAQVKRWADWLTENPTVVVRLEGHSDERGTREYNLGLGDRRAEAARSLMIAHGIAAARIKTVSYGKERPVCAGSEEGCWSQNRRGVLIVE